MSFDRLPSIEVRQQLFIAGIQPQFSAATGASPFYANAQAQVLILVLVTAILRIAFAAMLGLGVDESYMVASGRHLHLSYFDHPPISWWLQWGASHLFGSDLPVLVRLPFIALFAVSTWLMYRLTARLFSERAGVWAVVAFNLAPVFGVTSASWVLPDGPLDTALLGFMLCLVRAVEPGKHQRWRWWAGVGMCAGLALLAKYTAGLVLLGTVVAMLSHPVHRRWLWRLQPWSAILLAGALFSPVIVWNAEHHWCSITFQGARAVSGSWHPFAPMTVFGGEALYLLPWIWLPMMVATIAALRRGPLDWSRWLLACSGTPIILFFAVVGIWSSSHVLFHWAAPGYLMLFPLLGASLERWARGRQKIVQRVAIATAGFVVLSATIVGSEARWNWLPYFGEHFASGADPDLAAIDWVSVLPQMRARDWIGPGKPVVATLRWYDAGKLDYALGGAATVICLGDSPHEFGLTHPAIFYAGKDMLILAPSSKPAQVEAAIGNLFERVDPQPVLAVFHGGRVAMEIPAYIGRHYQPR